MPNENQKIRAVPSTYSTTPGLPWTVYLPTLVLIAQAVFLLQHEQTQTDRQTQRHRRNWSTYSRHCDSRRRGQLL